MKSFDKKGCILTKKFKEKLYEVDQGGGKSRNVIKVKAFGNRESGEEEEDSESFETCSFDI